MAKTPTKSLLDDLTEEATLEEVMPEEVTPEVTFEIVVEDAVLPDAAVNEEVFISAATRAEMEAGRAHVARIAAELAAAKE